MKNIYINSSASLSAQPTFEKDFPLKDFVYYHSNTLSIIKPKYKKYISAGAARRMENAVKMGVVVAKKCLEKAGQVSVDAIVTGTGMGCLRDSEKFLERLLDNNEEFLTPTSFIQSTHNTVAGQIALVFKNKGYNMTYVHSNISFESALIDIMLQLELGEIDSALVGGVDEHGNQTNIFHQEIGLLRKEPVHTSQLIPNRAKGTIYGEGASFFVISTHKNENTVAKIIEVQTYNNLEKQNLEKTLTKFLKAHSLTPQDIDVLMLGNNGDKEFDSYYDEFGKLFPKTSKATFKQLCGEYSTSASFALSLIESIIKEQVIPSEICLEKYNKSEIKNILLYNQYLGENHSFILIQKC